MKKKLVIASVLKPVNDSRNYEKTAISINKSGIYQVHLVGQRVRALPMGSPILFNPLFAFHRLSPKRLMAGFIFLRYLFKIKPEAVVVTTFELLFPAVIYKTFRNAKLIYDVQENYVRNLIYSNSFPFPLGYLMAPWVRGLEYATRPWVNQYILAEKNYEKEFSFSRNKSVVLENKLTQSSVLPKQPHTGDTIQLLYTGTIAGNYGVFEAVTLAKNLHAKDERIRLVIAGFASDKGVLQTLNDFIKEYDFITLIGGNEFVAHPEILKLIASSDFGLIAYQPNKSTENCIPTKLYEYLAHELPYLISKNPIWEAYTNRYQAGITIDFKHPDIESIFTQMKSKFYTAKPGNEIYWEEDKLITLINK